MGFVPRLPSPGYVGRHWPGFKRLFGGIALWWRDKPWTWGDRLPWGLDIVSGPQGAGKTLAVTAMALAARERWGDSIRIASNYGLAVEDWPVNSPMEAVSILSKRRPGMPPLLLAIDEIGAWWEASRWQGIPPETAAVAAQQRKGRVWLLATVQQFRRVALVWREHSKHVFVPRCYLASRLLAIDSYRTDVYARWYESNEYGEPGEDDLPSRTSWHLITDAVRDAYDTYRVVSAIRDTAQRGSHRRDDLPALPVTGVACDSSPGGT